eukprot:gene5098-12902_t
MPGDVVDPRWAGSYDCSACGRKRLIAAEFSKRSLEKKRADESAKIKCKACIAVVEAKERAAAAANAKSGGGGGSSADGGGEPLECSACKKMKPPTDFSKGQRNKGLGKQRCARCVDAKEKALLEDAAAAKCKSSVSQTDPKATMAQKLAAASAEAAAEAPTESTFKLQLLNLAGIADRPFLMI